MFSNLKPKSEFSRNVLTLMTGTTIAQAIPIAISPILTRIYTPQDFGVLALFIAMTSIFGSIANARYELAIMLPKKDEDAINIVALGFIINVILSLFLLLVILIFHNNIIELLNNEEISFWLYFMPISVFLIGCFNLLNYFNNRIKNYKDLAKANIAKAIALSIVQLGLGLLKTGAVGLVSGQIVSQIVSNTKLFFNMKNINLFDSIKRVKIIALAKKYKNFPKFSLLGVFANTLSTQFINILISSFYTVSILGFYSLVQKILGMPSSLIGASIGQVFFQEASKAKQENGEAILVFKRTLKKLLLIGLVAFGLLYFVVEDLFAFVFGEKWRIAGIYAQLVIPLFFIRFISASVSTIYDIFEGLKVELIWQLCLMVGIIAILFIFKESDFKEFLTYMTAYSVVMYIISIYLTFQLAKGNLIYGK